MDRYARGTQISLKDPSRVRVWQDAFVTVLVHFYTDDCIQSDLDIESELREQTKKSNRNHPTNMQAQPADNRAAAKTTHSILLVSKTCKKLKNLEKKNYKM